MKFEKMLKDVRLGNVGVWIDGTVIHYEHCVFSIKGTADNFRPTVTQLNSDEWKVNIVR